MEDVSRGVSGSQHPLNSLPTIVPSQAGRKAVQTKSCSVFKATSSGFLSLTHRRRLFYGLEGASVKSLAVCSRGTGIVSETLYSVIVSSQ